MFRLLALVPISATLLRGRGSASLEPGYVADLLMSVQEQWIDDAVKPQGLSAMEKSCTEIASAIVQGSEGDQDRVTEYMNTVCSQPSFKKARSWQGDLCNSFASKMSSYMKNDSEYNRNYLDTKKLCASFYSEVEQMGEVEVKRKDQAKLKAMEEARAKLAEATKKKAEEQKHKMMDSAEKKKKAMEAKKKLEKLKTASKETKKTKIINSAKDELIKAHKVADKANKEKAATTKVTTGAKKPVNKEVKKETHKTEAKPVVKDAKMKTVNAAAHVAKPDAKKETKKEDKKDTKVASKKDVKTAAKKETKKEKTSATKKEKTPMIPKPAKEQAKKEVKKPKKFL